MSDGGIAQSIDSFRILLGTIDDVTEVGIAVLYSALLCIICSFFLAGTLRDLRQ